MSGNTPTLTLLSTAPSLSRKTTLPLPATAVSSTATATVPPQVPTLLALLPNEEMLMVVTKLGAVGSLRLRMSTPPWIELTTKSRLLVASKAEISAAPSPSPES